MAFVGFDLVGFKARSLSAVFSHSGQETLFLSTGIKIFLKLLPYQIANYHFLIPFIYSYDINRIGNFNEHLSRTLIIICQ